MDRARQLREDEKKVISGPATSAEPSDLAASDKIPPNEASPDDNDRGIFVDRVNRTRGGECSSTKACNDRVLSLDAVSSYIFFILLN